MSNSASLTLQYIDAQSHLLHANSPSLSPISSLKIKLAIWKERMVRRKDHWKKKVKKRNGRNCIWSSQRCTEEAECQADCRFRKSSHQSEPTRWWPSPRLRGFGENVRLLIPRLFFFSFFFFEVEINRCTLIRLFMPGSVHSGWASWDDYGRMFPDEMRVSSFPDRYPHYARTEA